MECISEPPYYCSKGVIKCVQSCTNITGNKGIEYMFEIKCSSIHQRFRKIVACYNKQKVKKVLTFPIFDNEFLSSSKQLKIGPKNCVFTIKHEDMCHYNFQCFMFGGLMLDYIIMNIFLETAEQEMNSMVNTFFAKIKDDRIHLYQGSLQDYAPKKTIPYTKKHYIQII